MTRRRLVFGVGVLVALVLVSVVVNEVGNAMARAELERSCGCARRSVEHTLAEADTTLFEIFGDDTNEVRSFMRGQVHGWCDELEAELAVGSWNLGRTWAPPRDADLLTRITRIVEQARPRCVQVFASFVSRFDAPRSAEDICDELYGDLGEPSAEAQSGIPVWDWPEVIDQSMCLDEVRSPREDLAEPP